MTNPYATWDANVSRATDERDGLPDRAMVPLVTELRARGVVTLQSCAGHEGSDDGCLWVRANVDIDRRAWRLLGPPFTYVRFVYWPEPRWEFEWLPQDCAKAVEGLRGLGYD